MPNYISHAIMGEQVHKIAVKSEDFFKVYIPKEMIRGYSLGADLAVFSRKTLVNPHDYYTRDFFLTMIQYIKNNNLTENNQIMALLYGHIAHYFFDINAHPLIYYIEGGCKRAGILSNHDLIEGYLSSYLCEKILKKNIMEITPSYFNNISLNDIEIIKTLNSVYGSVYKDYNIVKSYKRVIAVFTFLENIIKSGLVSQEMLIRISNFNVFLEKNNLTYSELINSEHNTFFNPITGEAHNESFMDLYNRSIEMTLDAIVEVNSYLYSNGSISALETVFTDLSYNTGVPGFLGNQMVYVRKTTMF